MATTSDTVCAKAGTAGIAREPGMPRASARALKGGSGVGQRPRVLPIVAVAILAATTMGVALSAPDDAVAVLTKPPKITAMFCFIEALGDTTSTSMCASSSAFDAAGKRLTPDETTPASLPIGLHKVVVRAEDSNGNWASTTRAILVEDTTAPEMPDLAPCVIEAAGRKTPTAACDVPTGIVCDIPKSLPVSPRKPYTCTATDSHGNFATKEIYVTVEDTTPPTCTSSRIPTYIEARGKFTEIAITDNNIMPSDGEDSNFELSHSHAPIAVEDWGFIRWTVTDGAGLTASCTQAVIVHDTTPPSFPTTLDPVPVTSAVPVSVSSVTLTPPVVTDIADPNPAVYHEEEGTFAVGENTVTWFAIDESTNMSSATQKVIVQPAQTP